MNARRDSFMHSALIYGALVSLVAACSKSDSPAAPAASSSAVVTASAPSAFAASSSNAAASGAAAPKGAPRSWSGSYEATAGTLTVPDGKEWEGVKFRGEKSEVGLGKGELHLEIDSRGTVTGTLEGPLGPAVISGTLDGDTLTARIDRKSPADLGFYGTLSGKTTGDALEGTMHLSQGEARVIREATFTLKH